MRLGAHCGVLQRGRVLVWLSSRAAKIWLTQLSFHPCDFALVSKGYLYGPMALKVFQEFLPRLALAHGWLFADRARICPWKAGQYFLNALGLLRPSKLTECSLFGLP